MSNLMRRAGIVALILGGLLAGHGAAQAQPGFNPSTGQRQSLYNLQVGRSAFANNMFSNPGNTAPYAGTAAYNPYMAFGGSPYAGFGVNPYTPGTPGVALDPTASMAGSNPYSPLAAADPYSANPYLTTPYSGISSNPAIGPGFTLMGAADVMRAYGTVIIKQEQARSLRQEYYRSRLDTKKAAFDLEMYLRNNTPTFNQEQEKIAKSVLRRIQVASNPAEIVDGRSLNFLLDDVDKYYTKATITDIPLDESAVKQLNIKPAGLAGTSLGVLRDAGKLYFPSALVKMLPPDVRTDIESKAQNLAQVAAKGKQADPNALADFQAQIDQAMKQLLKKANEFDTGPYMDAKRFLGDLENARKAIEAGTARHQLQFQQMIAKGEIQNVNQLVAAMIKNGWRFAPATLSDEAAYRAVHSALVAYDVAVNQQVASADGN